MLEKWKPVLSSKQCILGACFIIIAVIAVSIILYKPLKADYVTAQYQDFTPSLLLSGEVIPRSSSRLAAPSSGVILKTLVSSGDVVKKGQLLVSMDAREAKAQYDRSVSAFEESTLRLLQARTETRESARIDLEKAQRDLYQSTLELERHRALFEAGSISRQSYEKQLQDHEDKQQACEMAGIHLASYEDGGSSIQILQSLLLQKEAEMEAARLTLENLQVVAPFDGQVLEFYASPGEYQTAGTPLLLLASMDQVRVEILPDQQYQNIVVPGARADLWLPGHSPQRGQGIIVSKAPQGDPEQGTFKAEIEIQEIENQLLPGTIVSVQVFAPQTLKAMLLPERYITSVNGKAGVYVEKNGLAEFRLINIEQYSDGYAVVPSGLIEGEIVLDRVSPRREYKMRTQ